MPSVFLADASMLAVTCHAALVGWAAATPLWRATPAGADSFLLRAFFALTLGLAIDIALLFILGIGGVLYLQTALAVGAGSAGAAAMWLWRTKNSLNLARPSAADLAIMAAFLIWAAAAAVRVPGFFDDTAYHLPLAKYYAETHGLGLDAYVRFPLFPQNMELLFTLGFLLSPGDVLGAQGFAALPAFVIALGLVGAARWLRNSYLVGIGAAVIFLSMPITDRLLGYAYIDVGLALFCFAAMLGAILFAGSAPLGVYAVLGVFAGTAAGCKIYGLVAAAIVMLLLVAGRARLSALVVYAAATAVVGCGWYMRSYAISGDPISPAGGPWFGYFLWNASDLVAQRAELATHGVGTALWKFPQSLIKAGANWLLPGLAAPLAARGERRVLMLWAAFVGYALFWFYVTQVERYLAPVHAIGALLSATLLYDALSCLVGWLAPRALAFGRRPAVAAGAAALLLVVAAERPVERAFVTAGKWDRILATRQGFKILQAANAEAPRYGRRLVQLRLEGARYFYDGAMIGDWFGPGRYDQMWLRDTLKPIPAKEMRDLLARFDAKLLAIDYSELPFDPHDYDSEFETLASMGSRFCSA